jgi:hypothetical protein
MLRRLMQNLDIFQDTNRVSGCMPASAAAALMTDAWPGSSSAAGVRQSQMLHRLLTRRLTRINRHASPANAALGG